MEGLTAKDVKAVHFMPHDWALGILQEDAVFTNGLQYCRGDHRADANCICHPVSAHPMSALELTGHREPVMWHGFWSNRALPQAVTLRRYGH